MMKLNLWLVGGSVLLSLPLVSILYPVWTSGTLTLDRWTLGFLVGRFLLWTMWIASSTVLWAINRHYFAAIALVAEALLNGFVAYCLIPNLGIRGAALGSLLADLAVCAWLMPLLLTREFREPFTSVARSALRASCPLILTTSLCFTIRYFSSSRVVDYALTFPACVVLGLALMFRELQDTERLLLRGLWMKVRGKYQGQVGKEVVWPITA